MEGGSAKDAGEAGSRDLREARLALESAMDEMTPMLDRLDALGAGYASMKDPRRSQAERSRVRLELEARVSGFPDSAKAFKELRGLRQAEAMHRIILEGRTERLKETIADTVELEGFSRGLEAFKSRLGRTLRDEEGLYAEAKTTFLRKRRRAWTAAGLPALAVLAAGFSWAVWSARRRAGSPVPALPARTSADFGPGSVLGGNFRLERELGRGGMGVVYEAMDLTLRRRVAVKAMREELLQDPGDLEAFLNEARLVAALKHPNIVEIHGVAREAGRVYLVFEYVSGRPLDGFLRERGRLSLPEIRGILGHLAPALDYAHSRRVIHRDFKPANVMLTREGLAKVMDFGIAHQAKLTAAKLTRAASWGTPPYMAPEQELGSVSKESDLFALGVCLYEMATGALPFMGPDFLSQKRRRLYVPPSRLTAGLPSSFDEAIRKSLDPEPSLRFHSAAEMAAALT